MHVTKKKFLLYLISVLTLLYKCFIKEFLKKKIDNHKMAKSQNKNSAAAGLSNYELRWNDHIPYFTNIFQSLRDLNELTDVTFACEDGIVCAHKIVLSSCSGYLRILFTRLGTPHPVIFLKNTPVKLVRHILEFIYCGSVKVSKEELALVLNLGHSLQIQGLSKLKLSEDDDFGVDKRVDKLTKEREKLQESIASKVPLLPGEVKKSPRVSLNNGKGTELDLENNNNDLTNPKITRQSKTSVNVVQSKEKKTKEQSKASAKVVQSQKKKTKAPSKAFSKVVQNKKRKTRQQSRTSSKVIQNKEMKNKAQSNTSSKVIQNREKNDKRKNDEKYSKPEKPQQQKSLQEKLQKLQKSQTEKKKQNCKSKPDNKKIKTKVKPGIGSRVKKKNIAVANIKTNKKALADKLVTLKELKPIKFSTPTRSHYRYDPRLKNLIGKYYMDHGFSKAKKFFEKHFGFEIPDQTLWKMKGVFLANRRKSE